MQSNLTETIIISLYQAYPSYHGASDITYNLFKEWPNKVKLIQISSNKTSINKKNIITVYKNKRLNTILILFKVTLIAKKLLHKTKKKTIIIEGASWAGYSLILIFLIKFFFKDIRIIYHAHNLEYEVRKFKNSKFILFITFYIERLIYNFTIGTAVSAKDLIFIKKKFKKKSILFENGIIKEEKKYLSKLNLKKDKYIFFCGSYTYWPNKIAIDTIIQQSHLIFKHFSDIKIVLTGEGIPKSIDKRILNLGIVNKRNLSWLYQNCKFFYAPMPKAPGTKIKIIEALCYNATVFCTKYSLYGLNKIYNKNSIYIITKKKFEDQLVKFKRKKKVNINNSHFSYYYNFKNIIINFYKKLINV